jgi:hypothetical protein
MRRASLISCDQSGPEGDIVTSIGRHGSIHAGVLSKGRVVWRCTPPALKG